MSLAAFEPGTSSERAMLSFFRGHDEILQCPRCSGSLHVAETTVRCEGCHHVFAIDNGIPLLFSPNDWDPTKPDVTHDVQAFYEKTPFPNYDDFDSIGS